MPTVHPGKCMQYTHIIVKNIEEVNPFTATPLTDLVQQCEKSHQTDRPPIASASGECNPLAETTQHLPARWHPSTLRNESLIFAQHVLWH